MGGEWLVDGEWWVVGDGWVVGGEGLNICHAVVTHIKHSTQQGIFTEEHMFPIAEIGDANKFYLPGKQLGDSSVLCWPARDSNRRLVVF